MKLLISMGNETQRQRSEKRDRQRHTQGQRHIDETFSISLTDLLFFFFCSENNLKLKKALEPLQALPEEEMRRLRGDAIEAELPHEYIYGFTARYMVRRESISWKGLYCCGSLVGLLGT